MRLKVSSSNFYVGNPHPEAGAHVLASQNCDISGVQEGHSGNAQAIRRALHSTHVVWWETGRKDPEKDFGMLDVPVVYKKDLNVLKRWARQVSARAEVKNIGMQRAATAVRFKKGGVNVTFINTHLNAAVKGHSKTATHLPTTIKRVFEYTRSIIVLQSMIQNAQKRGDLVVVVGDLNYSVDRRGVWRYSPQALFKRTGLHFKSQGLDYIAVSKKFKFDKFYEIPAGARTGADHPWVFAELTTT